MKKAIKASGILIIFCLLLSSLSAPIPARAGVDAQSGQGTGTPAADNPYFSSTLITTADGTVLEKMTISGPPVPPPGYEVQRAARALPAPHPALGSNSLIVPAYDWVFGCSAVSSAMIAGYYDNNGFPNMYTGPTNGGAAPIDSSPWPYWSDGDRTYPNNPLVASHNGVDGRSTRGSIDDYWVKLDSSANDPYITGGWTQHAWDSAVGDFLKTSQSAYGNPDGSTVFYNYGDSTVLTCKAMESQNIHTKDGTYGRKLFYQARGYTVTDCYNQTTDNRAAGGFSFAQYKAEIDAGNPVLLNLNGHSIVGVGYDSATNTVYLHDTWDYQTHSMPWGDSYSGMVLLSVSIVHVAPGPFSKSSPGNPAPPQPTNPTLVWGTSSGATSYEYCYDTSDDSQCSNWADAGTSTSKGLTGLDSGATYYWQVRARNTAGTTEANDNVWWKFSVKYLPPTITTFSPTTGPVGTSVTITGTHFTGATAVAFNGVSAAFSVNSATSITATVPQGAATGKISVTTPGGTATSSADFTLPAPVYVQFSAPTYPAAESDGTVSIPVALTAASSQPVTVHYTTVNGTATGGQDYSASSGTLTFPVGATTQAISITVIDDALDEPDSETMYLTLSNPVNASITGSNPAALTIADNDAPPEIAFGAPTYTAGENSGSVTIPVTLSAASAQTVTVHYATSNGTAAAGQDYTASTGTLTFPAGGTTQQIHITVTDDLLDEMDSETVLLTLSAPVNASIAGGSPATLTITDNDAPPEARFSAAQIAVDETSGQAVVTVTLSAASAKTVTAGYAVSGGTAKAGSDYTSLSIPGVLTFKPGQVSQSFTIPIIDDSVHEPSETITLVLGDLSNAAPGAPAAIVVTIADNDAEQPKPLAVFIPFVNR